MPVHYYSQETAWMDQEIFREWFHDHFVPTVRSHLRYQGLPETALLLIDRSTSHPSDQFLRSDDSFFFCQYFPAKVKALIQPMEQGVISNMKRNYRRDLLIDLISKGSSIVDFQKCLSLKDAIRGISQGWDSVNEDTIRQCFAKIFPLTSDNVETGADTEITTDAFEKLIRQIPECNDYSYERLEKWLNCDEAEPQKDCNPFKATEDVQEQQEQSETQEENIVFIDLQHEDAPQTIEILNSSDLTHQSATIMEQDESEEEELLDDDTEETLSHRETVNQMESNIIFEDTNDVSCKQALDALNVLLKFMKNDSDSRYKDVMMLQQLKKKLRRKVTGASDSIKTEITEIEYS